MKNYASVPALMDFVRYLHVWAQQEEEKYWEPRRILKHGIDSYINTQSYTNCFGDFAIVHRTRFVDKR